MGLFRLSDLSRVGLMRRKTGRHKTLDEPNTSTKWEPRELVLRVACRALTPPLSLFRSGGSAARREDGLGGWFSPVDSSSRSRCWLCFAPVASGVMPLSSFPSARASRVRWSLTAAQACCPWRTGADGSGSGESSLNKLEGRLDLTKAKLISPYTLCH